MSTEPVAAGPGSEIDFPAPNDFLPGGPSTGGVFDLKQTAQILFQARGGAAVPPGSRIRTMLYHHPLGRSFELSRAEIGIGTATNYVLMTNGSLRLDAGRYSWYSEINPMPFDEIGGYFLRATAANSPDPVETRGAREVVSAMSGQAGTNVFARARIDAQIGDSEEFSAQLVVTNLMTLQQFSTPPLKGIGPTEGEVEIGVVPYVLTAGQIFSARFKVDYNGTGTVRSALRNTYS